MKIDYSEVGDRLIQISEEVIQAKKEGRSTTLYLRTCPGEEPWPIELADGAPGGPTYVPPQVLVEQAALTLPIVAPIVVLDPFYQLEDGRRATLKNIETWVWIESANWNATMERVSSGPVWAELTARPTTITITPNDGVTEPKQCAGSGTPIPPDTPVDEPSPTCSLKFKQETDGGTWPVTVTVRYELTWTGFDGVNAVSGTLDPIQSPPLTIPLAVLMAKPQLVDPYGD